MSKRIITISREFGSGGRYIGEEIAKKLNITYYDKEIIAKTAEQTGLAKDFIEKKGEYAPTGNIFAYAFVGRSVGGTSVDDYLASVQRKIILEAAEKEPCVIIGRGADYILGDRRDCLNVFIHGDKEAKSERIQKLYGKTEKEAEQMMRDMDKRRSMNYKYYTDRNWGYAANYMLTLNSNRIGYEKCIEIITELYEA